MQEWLVLYQSCLFLYQKHSMQAWLILYQSYGMQEWLILYQKLACRNGSFSTRAMACRNGYFSEVSRLYLWDIFAALIRLFVRDVLARCHFQHSKKVRLWLVEDVILLCMVLLMVVHHLPWLRSPIVQTVCSD